ncbi:hypothetical protein PVK06_043394 [Gossypium arboreum]|uniref:Uncharacterized protein n=1 Tax=Gossypium arboreum TaxID=29729 RepID=A0ABR0MNH3_GOSAR|nr:hypothetical protein PVK06_043394 [Gossypium arboreum]
MCKKHRTDMGLVNVLISNEENADSGRLEQHRKKRADRAGPSTMIVNPPTSPSVSSPSVAHNSKNFYLDEDPIDTSTTPTNNNVNNEADEDTAEANIALVNGNDNNKVAKRRKGKDEISSDHEGANNMP